MRITLTTGLVSLWLASLPIVTFARVQTWTNDEALWRGAAWWAQMKLRPQMQLGEIAHRQGLDASPYFERAIRRFASGHRPAFERVGCQIAVRNLVTVLDTQWRFAEADRWGSYQCDGPLSW